MPTMVERVRAICKVKGIPVSQLEKDLGYANGYLNPKKAETIRKDRIAEIAQYLGVSATEKETLYQLKVQGFSYLSMLCGYG